MTPSMAAACDIVLDKETPPVEGASAPLHLNRSTKPAAADEVA